MQTRTITVDGRPFKVMLEEEASDCFCVTVALGDCPDLTLDDWDEQTYDTLEEAQNAYDAVTEDHLRKWADGGFEDFAHFLL